MKTAIVFFSVHHGNTKKLVDAIAKQHEVTLIDLTKTKYADLTEFNRIGIASGIYYNKFSKQIMDFVFDNLPYGKDVFFLCTSSFLRSSNFNLIRHVVESRGCRELGGYQCLGYGTYGPFERDGIAEGHPTDEEIIPQEGNKIVPQI